MENVLVKKLRLGTCKRALIMNTPEGYIEMLNPLPEGVLLTELNEDAQAYDFVPIFADAKREETRIARILKR